MIFIKNLTAKTESVVIKSEYVEASQGNRREAELREAENFSVVVARTYSVREDERGLRSFSSPGIRIEVVALRDYTSRISLLFER